MRNRVAGWMGVVCLGAGLGLAGCGGVDPHGGPVTSAVGDTGGIKGANDSTTDGGAPDRSCGAVGQPCCPALQSDSVSGDDTTGTCNDDLLACNGVEACVNGTCQHVNPITCGPSPVPCTTLGCLEPLGLCVTQPADEGDPCTPLLNACVVNGTCHAGACVGQPRDCSNGNPCIVSGCDPLLGCQLPSTLPDGTPCGSDACSVSACMGGVCTVTSTTSCDDANPCTADSCDPRGGCTHTPVADGTQCAPSDACLAGLCKSGVCTPVATNCDDGDPCTIDSCDPIKGCLHVTAPDGTPCGDCRQCVSGCCQ